jgi:hypothetical protein
MQIVHCTRCGKEFDVTNEVLEILKNPKVKEVELGELSKRLGDGCLGNKRHELKLGVSCLEEHRTRYGKKKHMNQIRRRK